MIVILRMEPRVSLIMRMREVRMEVNSNLVRKSSDRGVSLHWCEIRIQDHVLVVRLLDQIGAPGTMEVGTVPRSKHNGTSTLKIPRLTLKPIKDIK